MPSPQRAIAGRSQRAGPPNLIASESLDDRDVLEDALAAENEQALQHWETMHSRTYVANLLRSLGTGGVFQRGVHNDKDPETGRNRRRSTFTLNRDSQLVQQVVAALWPNQQPPSDEETSEPPAQIAPSPESENGFLAEPPEEQLPAEVLSASGG